MLDKRALDAYLTQSDEEANRDWFEGGQEKAGEMPAGLDPMSWHLAEAYRLTTELKFFGAGVITIALEQAWCYYQMCPVSETTGADMASYGLAEKEALHG